MTTVLEHRIPCGGTMIDVVTVRDSGESLAAFAARHRARVQEARDDCGGDTSTPLAFNSTWVSGGESVTARAPSSYGTAAYQSDVSALLANEWPKDV